MQKSINCALRYRLRKFSYIEELRLYISTISPASIVSEKVIDDPARYSENFESVTELSSIYKREIPIRVVFKDLSNVYIDWVILGECQGIEEDSMYTEINPTQFSLIKRKFTMLLGHNIVTDIKIVMQVWDDLESKEIIPDW